MRRNPARSRRALRLTKRSLNTHVRNARIARDNFSIAVI
jgi:hypothetical protein